MWASECLNCVSCTCQEKTVQVCVTWHAGAQSHNRYCSDGVLEADGAAEVTGNVPDECRQEPDARYRHDKARPAT